MADVFKWFSPVASEKEDMLWKMFFSAMEKFSYELRIKEKIRKSFCDARQSFLTLNIKPQNFVRFHPSLTRFVKVQKF